MFDPLSYRDTLSDSPTWSGFSYSVPPLSILSKVPDSNVAYSLQEVPYTIQEVAGASPRKYHEEGQSWVYPSITTVLGGTDDEGKQAIKEWQDKIGHEDAENIRNKSAKRGNNWHRFAELFLARKPTWSCITEPSAVSYAAMLGHILNHHVKGILLSEARLVSHSLKVAGRLDLMAQLNDGRYAIIDLKSSRFKPKGDKRLESYGAQAKFYAEAVEETFYPDAKIDVLVVMQLAPKIITWQESDPKEWNEKLQKRIDLFEARQIVPK